MLIYFMVKISDKELFVKPKSSISLQKHLHRSEHWLVTSGNPLITLGKKKFQKNPMIQSLYPLEQFIE